MLVHVFVLFSLLCALYQERNKPKEAPKAPMEAPFFLPTIAGTEMKFAVPAPEQETNDKSANQKSAHAPGDRSELGRLLVQASQDSDNDCEYRGVEYEADRGRRKGCQGVIKGREQMK